MTTRGSGAGSTLAAGAVLLAGALAAAPSVGAAPSAADRVVDAMIAAHGGMEAWENAPTVSFTDTWYMGESTQGQASHVMVEQGRRRAVIDMAEDGGSLAWDGEKAWSMNWMSPIPPRFLALLNYYFLNLPWLVKDPGVILGEPGTRTLWDDPTRYTTVRVTYEAGTGDTPDDYYILLIDPGTHRLAGCEYVVTYAELLPPGVEHTPPHILLFEEYETVNGLLVPTRYAIYEEDHSVYARCEVTDWALDRPFDASRMEMPEGARLDTSRPTRGDGN